MQGLSIGGVQLIIYNVYGIAFFYGAYAVADGRRDGGHIITSLLAALMGGIMMGMVCVCMGGRAGFGGEDKGR